MRCDIAPQESNRSSVSRVAISISRRSGSQYRRSAARSFEHARGLLERRCRDERVGRQRRLRDAEQQRRSVGGLAAAVHHLFVLLHEAEAVDLLVDEEVRVANARHANRAQHLAADRLDVLVVDLHRLRAVDLLDLVHQVALQRYRPG